MTSLSGANLNNGAAVDPRGEGMDSPSTFPAYPAYKESGVEWLGDIPIDWTLSKVKYDSYVKARVGWHGLKSDEFTDEGPYLVTGSDFKNRVVEWASCYHCTSERFEQDKYIQLREGDLLITKDGTIGKLILVEDLPGQATLNSGIFVVRPLQQKYSTRFYFWIMQSSVFHDFIGLNKTGSTIIHLYQETFENLPYALPAFVEQTQIARFLDQEIARIDALIEEQQRLIELLKEKRQAVIFHAVTKGLDPTVPMKDSGVEWLGEVPMHWAVAPTSYHYEIQLGRMLNEQRAQGEYLKPYLRVSDVQWNAINTLDLPLMDFPPEAQLSYRLKSGDLLVNEGGSYVGRSAIWRGELDECYYQKALHRLRPRDSRQDTAEFFLYVMEMATQRGVFVAGGNQTTIDHLTAEQLRQYRFAFPPLKEQQQIAIHVSQEASKVSSTVCEAEKLIILLQERRSALISAAVTGKIDVRGWQPQPARHPLN